MHHSSITSFTLLPSSSQTSIAEILVKDGFRFPLLIGKLVEEAGRLFAPFPRGTGTINGLPGITFKVNKLNVHYKLAAKGKF